MKKSGIELSDINFLDPGLQENPYEAYEVLRKEAPVYLSPDTGFFVVSKYNDLKRVLTDFEFFSRDLSGYWDKEIKEENKKMVTGRTEKRLKKFLWKRVGDR